MEGSLIRYGCDGKRRYHDLAQAKEAIKTIQYHHPNSSDLPTRAYECDHCKGAHITSQETWHGNHLPDGPTETSGEAASKADDLLDQARRMREETIKRLEGDN
jgi:hypothetical protein